MTPRQKHIHELLYSNEGRCELVDRIVGVEDMCLELFDAMRDAPGGCQHTCVHSHHCRHTGKCWYEGKFAEYGMVRP